MELLNAPELNIFEPALQRLILCGGGGLPAAYGPLVCVNGYTWTLDASGYALRIPAGGQEPIRSALAVLALPAMWTLPLDHWRSRLALVAAWMIAPPMSLKYLAAARLDPTPDSICLRVWLGGGDTMTYEWALSGDSGACSWAGRAVPLPHTLPVHLTQHEVHVALLLALYDVPKIRARLEGMSDDELPAPGAL